MGVYIKGMEMPKSCLNCPFCLFADGYWKCLVDGSHADFGGTCRPQNCPLVQVPTTHGRLIEESALLKGCGYIIADGMACIPVKHIANAPTIIEEER